VRHEQFTGHLLGGTFQRVPAGIAVPTRSVPCSVHRSICWPIHSSILPVRWVGGIQRAVAGRMSPPPGLVRPGDQEGRTGMAGSRRTPPGDGGLTERIVDIDVEQEMQGAFLEYAYSVIYSRALPDARDGLKPVQRRILYTMTEMGLRPDRAHVKCGRIVGDVMGKLHPHGDGAIYDALVRLAQDFTMRLPLVDGHGNFGSLDDGAAAYRYTEARMATAAQLMTDGLDEDVVDFVPNYDSQLNQPEVLPAALPNLLVNGASGIAVGMATNMPPHNLVEVVGAARHLLAHPEASLEDLMRFVPGPDLPTGGKIVGLDGVREAYATGRGSFRTRATTRVENVTARRQGIVVTELPYLVGPLRVIEKIKDLVQAKKLQGIADVIDLTDREKGLRLVIELKGGFNPEGVLEHLYRMTPLEENFSVNNVALVDGQPRTLGLREMLTVYIGHRLDVVRRRCTHRLGKARERLHLIEGLLIAILDIDEVIAVIRGSDDTGQARERLIGVFDLSRLQADYILEMPLRRLTKFSKLELETEKAEKEATIEDLSAVLADESLQRAMVGDELTDVATAFGTPRRTVLLESSGNTVTTSRATPLEVADDPCWVLLSSTGLLARTTGDAALPAPDPARRAVHDAIVARVAATARGQVAAVTTLGRMIRLGVLDIPALPPSSTAPALSGGARIEEFLALAKGERVITLVSLADGSAGLAVGTATGVVKRVLVDYPANKDSWEIIALREGDHLVGAAELGSDRADLVFVTSDAHLLRFGADKVRPQGRGAGGMAGVSLAQGAAAVFFGAVDLNVDDGEWASVVVTVAGSSYGLPGTQAGSVKVTPFAEFPAKGRATSGVRCHRFLKGEDTLLLAWAGQAPALAAAGNGVAVDLPAADPRRDGSGTPLPQPIAAIAGRP
jgi:DNA gyrase subunit A